MPDPRRIPEHISVLETLTHEHFTAEELAELLGIGASVVREAARRGELHAYLVDHRVIDITRADAIVWLKQRMKATR